MYGRSIMRSIGVLAACTLYAACTCTVGSPPHAASAATLEHAPQEEGSTKFQHQAMGTLFEITMYPPKPGMVHDDMAYIADKAWEAVDALELKISNWLPESELSQVNRQANLQPVKVGGAVFDLISISKKIHADTGGAFDPTVGPLLKLWGFYKKEGHLPGEVELEEALARVGLDMVELNTQDSTVRFKKSRMYLDFGGIGKGYAVDLAVGVLKEEGVTAALVHGGTSTAYGIGHPPGKRGWTVRMEQSYNTERTYTEVFEIADECFNTSSGVENFFELEGRRYCHIFSPKTGLPAEGVLTAMCIAPDGTIGDALSTAFYVMGEAGVKEYCERHPEIRVLLMVPGAAGAVETRRFNFK